MPRLTEKEIEMREREYYLNRKDIILDGMKKARLREKLQFITLGNLAIFSSSMILAFACKLCNLDLSSGFETGLVVLSGLTGFSTLGFGATGDFVDKEVKDISHDVETKDAVINYKEEMNSDNMKTFISLVCPSLFKKIKRSKLNKPINMFTYAKFSEEEQELVLEEAVRLRELFEENNEIEVIDFIEESNKEIIEEAKRRKFINRRHK